ncbi:amino acid transporter [Penicillium alfredii]|uniref:Amino acid transporter n=1 Tax=Penicillium alfredii TaxID=1506179 RepID=A0A9W9FS62_9EURO|nr:amino acid transporter [Penicillium alfredii]KAJ5105035.1 amino acid transporter [Penicillium alfredii]
MPEGKDDIEELAPVPSQIGEVHNDPNYAHDAVFGEITEDGPNYRNVGWLGTVALMMKSQIGLGVLSIPAAFDVLGLVPGVICLCVVSAITTWSDYIIGVFKLRHREVYGIDDAGMLMFGRLGRDFLGFAFCLYWTFVAGSGMLSISIGLNAVSTHGACTAVFVVVAAILGFMLSSIQTLGRITWLAWVGLVCILTAIFIVTISVSVQDRPASAPQEGVWVSDFKVVNNPNFTQAVTAMRDPRLYTRSLLICQSGVTAVYIVIGCVLYYYCGSYVASPALGSAGTLMKKISYGLALPGLAVTTTLVIHLPAKYIFVRALRGSRHLASNTIIHWAAWLGCTFGIALIAYIIASAIPVFDGLVSLVGALLGTLMSFQPMGCMWLYDNWSSGKPAKTPKWIFLVGWSVFVIAIGTFMMVAGTYGSVVGIMDTYKASGGSAAWSCADNSNSV